MKPNFEQMTDAELRAYAREHRSEEDIEALRVLFKDACSTRENNTPQYLCIKECE